MENDQMTKRMLLMLTAVGLLFGGIFGYQTYKSRQAAKAMASGQAPPVTVTTIRAAATSWQPQLRAVGNLRAVHGVEVSSEIAGLVRSVHFKSGDEVKPGQLLVQLNADADIAQLHSLEAAAELAYVNHERDRKQFAVQAVSQATLDADTADLKGKRAQVDQQAALVEKKTLRAPFAGRVGISTVNPGQYLNPGDRIVTLQALDTLYMDFYLPQQELARLVLGQRVVVTTDTYPGRTFPGAISAINPLVDPATRNIRIEATINNPRHALLPGMYGSAEVLAGKAERYLTLPQTAVAFNPYGETVFIVEERGKGPDGKPLLIVKQAFVSVGPTRGDQVAILKGIAAGQIVVTSGQLKLKSGSAVIINNQVQPANDANPKPVDE
jgi:membrane fusion protein (multidrug efflux system)